MKEIIARILATANQLDAANLYQEADKLTKIAQDFGEQDISVNKPCTHENVEYGGNDGEREVYRSCYGYCLDCGADLEGYEIIEGADDEGNAEYSVQEWREVTPQHKLMLAANQLDEKRLFAFADTITKIAQQAQAYDGELGPRLNEQLGPDLDEAFDPKLHQLGTDIGKMFTAPPQQDIYAELKTFLSSLAGINTNYTNGNEVMIGAGMANHIKSEAQRLLADLKEYTGEEEENLDGPTDEQLFGIAEDQALRGDREQRTLEDAGRWNG